MNCKDQTKTATGFMNIADKIMTSLKTPIAERLNDAGYCEFCYGKLDYRYRVHDLNSLKFYDIAPEQKDKCRKIKNNELPEDKFMVFEYRACDQAMEWWLRDEFCNEFVSKYLRRFRPRKMFSPFDLAEAMIAKERHELLERKETVAYDRKSLLPT